MSALEKAQVGRARGMSFGATMMGGFGAMWLAVGAVSLGMPDRTAWPGVMLVAGLIALLGAAARNRLPEMGEPAAPECKAAMRALVMVNVAEWFAILGMVELLRNLHLEAWLTSAIVLIVGAHFVPLAQLFRSQAHLVTGLALAACAAVSLLLPPPERQAVACLGVGSVLWVSAAYALYGAFRAAPACAPVRALASGVRPAVR